MRTELQRKINEKSISEIQHAFLDHPYSARFAAPSVDARTADYIDLLDRHCRFMGHTSVIDLGSGLTPFPAILRHLGLKVHIVSMFNWLKEDPPELYSQAVIDNILSYFDKIGIVVHEFDIQNGNFLFSDNTFDAVTCFHVIEHFHNTPRYVFDEVYRILKPGGVFIAAVPNAVNLRKRFSVMMGRTNYYRFEEYYGHKTYFGHIREPTLKELKQYFLRSGFEIREVAGRNFIGLGGYLGSPSAIKRLFGRVLQRSIVPMLVLRPTLCSDLHMVGRKPRS